MRIIPAIDIIDGKCVRLTKGDYSTKKIYNESPLEVAKEFEASGIEYIHIVDLDGAKASKIINYKIVEQIASKTSLKIDFGGGLKSDKDLEIAFNSGANQITGGSIAVKNSFVFEGWIEKYGNDKIILGADFYPDTSGGKIATNGWQEESSLQLLPFIKGYQQKGIGYVICTDISKDGMLQGPSFTIYNQILKNVNPLKLIASGGISTFSELPILAKMVVKGLLLERQFMKTKLA